MIMWTVRFWKATSERVIASVAGGALSAMGADAFGVLDADWVAIASVAAGAGVVSLLKAIVAQGAKKNGPGLTGAERID